MFNVLIADDEPSVIESLKVSIDWESLGLVLAACERSGKEALERIEKEKIDVAILDIRMPGMNGLELCEYLKRQYEDLQIIFISGYAEFSYAQKAIGYGALGYCLKPLEYDQITKLLLKAVQRLEKSSRLISEADLLDALETGQYQEMELILKQLGFTETKYYVAVTVGERPIAVSADNGISVKFGRGQWGYILKKQFSAEELEEYISNSTCRSAGYFCRAVNVKELSAALDECIVRAYQFFVEPECRLNCEQNNGKGAGELLAQITKNAEKGRWDEVCGQLELIEKKYRKCFNIRSALRLCNIIYTGNLFREEANDYYIYNQKQLVTEYETFSGMLRRLRKSIVNASMASDEQGTFSNTAFMKLMHYISENYHKEISLTSAGEALHMNPNYVSQMFKKETGNTLIRYITQLRMEDATRLLATTQKPVMEIALEVGFNDYFYFLKTFKKITGKTPTQYREEN